MFDVAPVLQTEYLIAAIASEGKEIDLLAVVDGAVLSQIGKLRRPHRNRRAPNRNGTRIPAETEAKRNLIEEEEEEPSNFARANERLRFGGFLCGV